MGKCFQGQGAFFVPPGSSRLTHSPTPSLYDHTLSRQRQFGNLRWLPKIKSRQFLVSISCSVSKHLLFFFFIFCYAEDWPLCSLVAPPPPPPVAGQLRWEEREGEVWVESSRLQSTPLLRLNCTTLLHSLHALLFLHFQQYRVFFILGSSC